MAIKQADVIARLKRGETMIRVLLRDGGKDASYQYLSGGGRVTAATYAKLTNSDDPMVAPASNGLFPDAEPQEWKWAHD